MFQLKPLSKESIPKALTRAKHYRLLNEPKQAESICSDILNIDPGNQLAILIFILAITDQFGLEKRTPTSKALELCNLLASEYEQKYYRGIIEERLGKAALKRSSPRVKYIAYEHYRKAMEYYDAAEKISPKDNQDAILRWNACVRGIKEFNLKPTTDDQGIQPLLDV